MTFLYASILAFNLFALLMFHRMTRTEMYGSVLFSMVFQLLVDIYLGVKLGLYGYFSSDVDYRTLLVIAGVFPALNLIFLNYYPFRRAFRYKALYIMGWSAFSVGYEWVSVQEGVFYYNGWKLWYSAIAYPAVFGILVLHLIFYRSLRKKDQVSMNRVGNS